MMKHFTHIISISLYVMCCFGATSFAQIHPITLDNQLTWGGDKETKLFLRTHKYQRFDISSRLNHQVPDTEQLQEIQKSLDPHCPLRTMTPDQSWSSRKHHPWSIRPRANNTGGWNYDPVPLFCKSLVEYDLNATDQGWDRGDWDIHTFPSDDSDRQLNFYAVFSDDTDLKIYFYIVFLDTDGAKQSAEVVIPSGSSLKNKTADSIGTNESPDTQSKQANDTAATPFGQETKSFDQLLTDNKFVTHAILFDVNSAVIKKESLPFIADLAKWLKDNPSVKLEIGGYTDDDGTPETNLILSHRRAEEIKAKLLAAGISKARLTTKSFGSSIPVSPNTTPEGKASNRRVEFIRK